MKQEHPMTPTAKEVANEVVANRKLHNANVHRDSGSWVVRHGRWRAFLLGNAVAAEH